MRVFISFDMEGVAGIVHWDQCTGSGPAYEMGRRLTLEEVTRHAALNVHPDEARRIIRVGARRADLRHARRRGSVRTTAKSGKP